MTSSSGENIHGKSASEKYAELSAEAAKIGMRLVRLDSASELEHSDIAQREDLLDFADKQVIPKAIAFRSWRRLQELYTAKVQLESFDIRTNVPFSTPLKFVNTPPLPTVHPELPESWIAWRQTLTDLDSFSLQRFVVQLDNTESRFGRNPQADLLGKGNGPVMFRLLKGFAQQLNVETSTSS